MRAVVDAGGGPGRRAAAWTVLVLVLAGAAPARAQLALDGSLGPAGAVPFDVPTSTWLVTDDLGQFSADRQSLFQSFSLFDLGAGETASFQSLEVPERVVARVTGGAASTIAGTLQSTIPGADLFLLNPNGMVFTQDAALDLEGSLYASTAGVLRFGDVDFVTGVAAALPPLMADPTEFGFLVDAPAPIDIVRTPEAGDPTPPPLQLPAGETLGVVGGDLRIDGVDRFEARAVQIFGGRVQLASVASAGVDVPVDVASFDAASFAPDELGDVALESGAILDVGSGAGTGSGSVVIRGGRFAMSGGQVVGFSQTAVASDPVAIDVEVAGRTGAGGEIEGIELDGGAVLASVSIASPSGAIELEGPRVAVRGSSTSIQSVAAGSAGPALRIAGGDLVVSDGALVTSRNLAGAAGGAIDVEMDGEVEVSGLGQVLSDSRSSGTGGDVSVEADRVRVVSVDTASAEVSQISALANGSGAGGELTVRAREVELRDGGQLRSTTRGSGAAGDLLLEGRAGERLERLVARGAVDAAGNVAPAGAFARSLGAGEGGELTIDAREVRVTDGANLSVRTFGSGSAGTLTIENASWVEIGSGPDGIAEVSAKGAEGDAGGVVIRTDVLRVVDGGNVSASALGVGDAGDVGVAAREVLVSGASGGNPSAIFSQSEVGASGAAGSIVLDVSESLTVSDGARISVQSNGGFAGDIEVRGTEQVVIADGSDVSAALLQNTPDASQGITADVRFVDVGRLEVIGSEITAETRGDNAGGTITVAALREVVLRDGARLTAESSGDADAGNVVIDAGRRFIAVNNSPLPDPSAPTGVVSTSSVAGAGGAVEIAASELVYLSDSRVETNVSQSGAEGDGGNVGIPQVGGPDVPPPDVRPQIVVLNRSRVVASATAGDGGRIDVDAANFLPSDQLLFDEELADARDSVLDATSDTGIEGEIVITSPDSELAGQLTPLPSSYLDASELMMTPCAARRARAGSFVVQSRGVAPPPDAPLSSGRAQEPGVDPAGCPSEEAMP